MVMASPQSQPEATGTDRSPGGPRTNRFKHHSGETRRKVEDISRDLRNLRETIPAIYNAKREGLEVAVDKMHDQLSNLHENPAVRGLRLDLKQQAKETSRLENTIKTLEEDLTDDRVTFRQAQVGWEDDVARIDDKTRELGWALRDELAKLRPLVEKHDEAWKWMEQFREKVPDELLTMSALKDIASRVDQLHESSPQGLTVETRTGNQVPIADALSQISFQLDLTTDAVKVVERAQVDLARAAQCGVGHPNRLGAGTYPEEVISRVARHWTKHVLQEAQLLGIRRMNDFAESELASDNPQDPENAASIIESTTSLLRHILDESLLDDASHTRARRSVRVYGRLRPVLHEALFAMAAITGDPCLTDFRIAQSLETLSLTLQRAVDQAKTPELNVHYGIMLLPYQPSMLNTRLPIVQNDHAALVPDLPPLPSTTHHAPPSCDVHVCRAYDGTVWRDHFRKMSPIFDQHQVPFISNEPFPSLDNYPPPLDGIKLDHDGPVPLPSLLMFSSIVSYVARTIMSLSVRDPISRTVDVAPLKPGFRLENAVFWYNQVRDVMCKATDQLITPEIAHANPELIPVLQRMADYLRRVLETITDIAKEESYYRLGERVPVLPHTILADTWIPRLHFHMNLALEYPDLTAIKEDDADWNVVPATIHSDDPLLTCPSSSDDEKA
jgi:hypothetical protein